MSEPLVVTEETFDADVLKSSQMVLVDFWAEWCAPCKMLDPIVGELARDYAGKLKVAKIDADASPNVMQAFAVMGLPTLLLFQDGQVIERISGLMPKDRVLDKLSPYLDENV